MIRFLCKINGKVVSQEEFENEFFKETKDLDFYDLEQAQEKLSAFGFIKINEIEFEMEELEEEEEL